MVLILQGEANEGLHDLAPSPMEGHSEDQDDRQSDRSDHDNNLDPEEGTLIQKSQISISTN